MTVLVLLLLFENCVTVCGSGCIYVDEYCCCGGYDYIWCCWCGLDCEIVVLTLLLTVLSRLLFLLLDVERITVCLTMILLEVGSVAVTVTLYIYIYIYIYIDKYVCMSLCCREGCGEVLLLIRMLLEPCWGMCDRYLLWSRWLCRRVCGWETLWGDRDGGQLWDYNNWYVRLWEEGMRLWVDWNYWRHKDNLGNRVMGTSMVGVPWYGVAVVNGRVLGLLCCWLMCV